MIADVDAVGPAVLVVVNVLVWGLVATLSLVAITFTSQNLGWSRLDLPFLIGTMFTGDRRVAHVLGFLIFTTVGWFLGFFYFLVFAMLGSAGWWIGALLGAAHGLLLLTVALPLLPNVHPRIASEHAGPDSVRLLEPPGFLALHYGWRTPFVVMVAQTVYGAVLGAGLG